MLILNASLDVDIGLCAYCPSHTGQIKDGTKARPRSSGKRTRTFILMLRRRSIKGHCHICLKDRKLERVHLARDNELMHRKEIGVIKSPGHAGQQQQVCRLLLTQFRASETVQPRRGMQPCGTNVGVCLGFSVQGRNAPCVHGPGGAPSKCTHCLCALQSTVKTDARLSTDVFDRVWCHDPRTSQACRRGQPA